MDTSSTHPPKYQDAARQPAPVWSRGDFQAVREALALALKLELMLAGVGRGALARPPHRR